MSDTVIKIEHLWKQYRLGVIGYGSLRADMQSWWARRWGKEDPNRPLDVFDAGQGPRLDGDRLWALRDVSLEVPRGQVLGIIGQNGAGKSTLLKILSRITTPTRGAVKLKGRLASLLEVGTGFHPELTGRENIFLNGTILGMTKEEIRGKFDEIVDFSGIAAFLDTPVKRYSSGMYVRLAFSVAAHLDPEILVVDEVLAVGDAEFQEKCLGKMSEVSRTGRTILFVSHNMLAVRELCSRVILIDHGAVVAAGPAGPVIAQYLNRDNQEGAVLSREDLERLTLTKGGRGHTALEVQEVRLHDRKGAARNYFYSDEEIGVAVTYDCSTRLSDLVVIIVVQDEYRQPVLTVSNQDHAHAVYPHEPGRYQAGCLFPANLFGGRRFFVSVKFIIPGYGKLATPPVLWYEVEYTGRHGKGYYVCPRLPITVTRLDESAAAAGAN
jgi:lipopolysaccharide transport system ATP-binding protein